MLRIAEDVASDDPCEQWAEMLVAQVEAYLAKHAAFHAWIAVREMGS